MYCGSNIPVGAALTSICESPNRLPRLLARQKGGSPRTTRERRQRPGNIRHCISLTPTAVCIFPHLESGDGDAEQLELLREVEDGQEDGAEEGDLQEAEHDQPREQEVAYSPAATEKGRESKVIR